MIGRGPARAVFALLAGGLLAACTPSAEPAADVAPRSLVLCVVDTLRADALDSMPHLRALAAGGTDVELAYATSSWTRPSLASIFTGQFPSEHGVHEPRQPLPPSRRTLAEVLKERGYRTHAIVSNPILREKWGYGQGFERYDDELCLGPSAVTSERMAERALAALDELRKDDEPFFLFLLFFDPHWQYRGRGAIEPAGRLDGSQRTQELTEMTLRPEELAYIRALYAEEVCAVDDALERVLAAVPADTLIAVTADHGESLGEADGFFGHVENLREEIVHVPARLLGAPRVRTRSRLQPGEPAGDADRRFGASPASPGSSANARPSSKSTTCRHPFARRSERSGSESASRTGS